jgi:hypothetical protein
VSLIFDEDANLTDSSVKFSCIKNNIIDTNLLNKLSNLTIMVVILIISNKISTKKIPSSWKF